MGKTLIIVTVQKSHLKQTTIKEINYNNNNKHYTSISNAYQQTVSEYVWIPVLVLHQSEKQRGISAKNEKDNAVKTQTLLTQHYTQEMTKNSLNYELNIVTLDSYSHAIAKCPA